MKKLLALVLALVMVMGLATVGTSAAKYSDDADINYDEAVAVMSAIGVLEGADGKFRPAAELKRSEAAKIVAYLYYNNKTAAGLIGVGKFNDVPTNHWAAGYVDTLANAGVIAGRGNGGFDPDGDLKAIDFAKMLLVCIGYDPKIEGLVGSDYAINTSKLASQAGLFSGMADLKANDTLTREQAAQMAFNTIKAATVEYANKGGEIAVNGATVSLGNSGFKYVTTTLAKEQRISNRKLTNTGVNTDGGYTVEFGERQYPDLRLTETSDDFGRPASEWVYGKENVGKFVNKNLLMGSFTTYVTGADLYNLIGEAKIKHSTKINYYVNGKLYNYESTSKNTAGISATNMIKGNKVPYLYTGNGVLTEVYEKDEELVIVSILTYIAKVDGDFNTRSNTLALKDQSFKTGDDSALTGGIHVLGDKTYFNAPAPDSYNAAGLSLIAEAYDSRVSSDDLPEITKYKDGDMVLVRYAHKDVGGFKIAEITDVKSDAGLTLSQYSTGTEKVDAPAGANNAAFVAAYGDSRTFFYNGYVVTGGETKQYSKAVKLSDDMKDYNKKALDTTYTLYYDQYGYVIYAKPASSETKYVFIAGLDDANSNLGATTAKAFAIFSDGTSKNIKVNLSKSNKNIANYQILMNTGTWDHDDNAGTAEVDWWGSKDFAISKKTIGQKASPYYDRFGAGSYDYNRWFTYTTTGEGDNEVFTLSPCANSLMVSTDVANTADVFNKRDANNRVEINAKQPLLVGNDYYYGTVAAAVGNTLGQMRGYGNEKSVYITVKTASVSKRGVGHERTADGVNGKDYSRGISEVTGVATGIQNVNLTTFKRQGNETGETALSKVNPFSEAIWAVMDKNSYIIAAVVLGKDTGASNNYVYALSGAGAEGKDGSAYTWSFNAIVDGEAKVLKVKTDYKETIDNIKNTLDFVADGGHGSLMQVSFDKDGNVTEATTVSTTANDNDIYNNYKVFNVAGNPTPAANMSAYSTRYDKEVVYNAYNAAGDEYTYAGNTLYHKLKKTMDAAGYAANIADYAVDNGLTVIPGGKIWVVQQQRVQATGQLQTIWTECSDFGKALGLITCKTATDRQPTNSETTAVLNGYVSAPLDASGRAKWVVIKAVSNETPGVDAYHTYLLKNNSGANNDQKIEKGITLSDYAAGTGWTVTVTGFKGEKGIIDVKFDATVGGNAVHRDLQLNITGATNAESFTIGNMANNSIKLPATWLDGTTNASCSVSVRGYNDLGTVTKFDA